tara:strand:- start:152 stop:385 length:234 start_codon:yes stop_codon:yes gene_type:complete
MADLTINYKGVNIDCEFDYSPGEPMVMYYSDGSGYPGSPPDIELESIKIGDVEVIDMFDNLDKIEEISELIIEKYEQ